MRLSQLTQTLISLVLISLPSVTFAADDIERQSAVVLMYHKFGENKYPSTSVRLEQLDEQIAFLEANNFHIWPLEKIVEKIKNKEPLPDKTLAITIDDAYNSIYTEAYPRFKQRGWPFTVFVSTDYIDRKFSNYLSWEQMREMQQHGASYANHSRSHDYLVRRLVGESETQWAQRIRDDLNYAQKRLQQELKTPLKMLAYPYGEYDLALANIVKSIGLVAFGQHSGPVGHHSDMRFMPRFPVNEIYGQMKGLKTKLLSLNLPVAKQTPLEPVTHADIPELRLIFADSPARLGQLNCFASGQGAIKVEWVDKNKKEVTVRANSPISMGRSRYNCTAPSPERGRYYWFSQPWLKTAANN